MYRPSRVGLAPIRSSSRPSLVLLPLAVYGPAPTNRTDTEVGIEGRWCVRYGDALAWVEAPSEAAAVRRSLDFHRLGDWTGDTRELVDFPQDAYTEHAGPHDYTRAVLRLAGSHVCSSRYRNSRNVTARPGYWFRQARCSAPRGAGLLWPHRPFRAGFVILRQSSCSITTAPQGKGTAT